MSGVSLGHLLALAAAFASGAAAVLIWEARTPPSELTRGVEGGEPTAAGRLLDARVRARFPPGTSVHGPYRELSRKGFTPDWGEQPVAVRRTSSFPCGREAVVEWRTDEHGRITSVEGAYSEGCL